MSEFIEVGGRLTGPKITSICTSKGCIYFAPCILPNLVYGQRVVLKNKDADVGNQVYFAKNLAVFQSTHWVVASVLKPSQQELGSQLTFTQSKTGLTVFQPSDLLMQIEFKPVAGEFAVEEKEFEQVESYATIKKLSKSDLGKYDVVGVHEKDGSTSLWVFNERMNSLDNINGSGMYISLSLLKEDLSSLDAFYYVSKICRVSTQMDLLKVLGRRKINWDFLRHMPIKMTLKEIQQALEIPDLEIVE